MQDAEFDDLSKTVQVLGVEFFTVLPVQITSLVAAGHRRFHGRPVRDYMPMLVEQAVRARLRERQVSRAS